MALIRFRKIVLEQHLNLNLQLERKNLFSERFKLVGFSGKAHLNCSVIRNKRLLTFEKYKPQNKIANSFIMSPIRRFNGAPLCPGQTGQQARLLANNVDNIINSSTRQISSQNNNNNEILEHNLKSNTTISTSSSLSTNTTTSNEIKIDNTQSPVNDRFNNDSRSSKYSKAYSSSPYQQAAQLPSFTTMAGIQRLASEPTREHIENIRNMLRHINAKDNNDQEISLHKDKVNGIASICIKSAAKNGISAKMMCDFLDVIDDLYAWDEGRGVIIYGNNNFFCSGGDLVSVRELANYEDGLKMATLMQYNLIKLQTLPMITMSLIQGKAIGGGAEIAATTDLRMIAKSAKIGYVHARVGITAAWGGGARLVQLVGPSRAIDMMSSARLVNPDEALSMGLVNTIIDDTNLTQDQIMDEAKRYLADHMIGAKSTIVALKGIVNAARTLPLEQALLAEAQLLSSTWGKPPHMEALNSNVKHR